MNKDNNPESSTTGQISDNEIITRVLSGEKNLYAMLVRRYNERLYRVAMSIINSDADVEDVMQVAYTNAFQNLGKFKFQASFSTWLTKILINESMLKLKKRKRLIYLNSDTTFNEINRRQNMEVQTPVAKMINSELKVILEEAISRLPEKYRIVFVMREIENMNVAETKDCLGISEVNVKVRLNRAKALLRNSINDLYKKEDILHFHLSRCDKMVKEVLSQIEKM